MSLSSQVRVIRFFVNYTFIFILRIFINIILSKTYEDEISSLKGAENKEFPTFSDPQVFFFSDCKVGLIRPPDKL